MNLSIICAISIALSSWIFCAATAIGGKASLINQLIENEYRPVRLTVFSCTRQVEKAEFLQYITVTAEFQTFALKLNLTQTDELHQTWFVVSMDCNKSWTLLRQVR